MKTISDYTIYCTEEQTRKALGLGAPIVELPLITKMPQTICVKYGLFYKGEKCYQIPTSEQMIGWLESKDFKEIRVSNVMNYWMFEIFNHQSERIEVICGYISRKEATLAAIDAALEYLVTNNLIK